MYITRYFCDHIFSDNSIFDINCKIVFMCPLFLSSFSANINAKAQYSEIRRSIPRELFTQFDCVLRAHFHRASQFVHLMKIRVRDTITYAGILLRARDTRRGAGCSRDARGCTHSYAITLQSGHSRTN